MRVFVTGSSGFVGRRLVARLESAGHRPVGIEREHDVADASAIEEAVAASRPDALVHLAARSSVADSTRDPEGTFRVNFLGTRNLLRAVGRCARRARVLLVGSGDAYGAGPESRPPRRETDPLDPRNPYAWSKACAEWLGTLAARDGLDVVRVRPFNHTGAGQSERFVASSFARQVAAIALGLEPPRLRVGNLDSVRDFLDVEDVLDAYLGLLDPSTPAGLYNVASGRGTRIRSILETLVELSGIEPRIEVDPGRWRPTDCLVGDATRLAAQTGWRARRALRDSLSDLLAAWRHALSAGSPSSRTGA